MNRPVPHPLAPKSRADLVPCAACVYFDGNRSSPVGRCRRFPPQGGNTNQSGAFPVVYANGTCGEGRAEVVS